MGKWLSKVLEREVIPDKKIEGYLENNTDKTDRMPEPIVVHADVSPSMPHLTDGEREAYQEYIEEMTSSKHNLTVDQAKIGAMQLVLRPKQTLQNRQAAKEYKLDGYIKIWSTVLDEAIYLAKDEKTGKRVPDKCLPVFTEEDLKELDAKTLTPQEAKIIMLTKSVFGGSIKTGMVPEFIQNDSTKKTNLTKKVLADGRTESVGKT